MHSIEELIQLSERLSRAPNLLPRHARTPDEILAITLAGQELGFGPMAALRNLQVVSGKVTLTADAMLGLVAKAGVLISWVKDGTEGEAVLHLRRGQQEHTQRWTEEDRKAAGLNTATWKSYRPAMLRARCVSAAIRAFCPDVLSGAYVPGELPDDTYEEGPGSLDTLVKRAPATGLPPEGKKAIEQAKAAGFVPKHPIAEDPFVAVDLECLTSTEALVEWLREAMQRAGQDADAKAVVWHAFSERCAALEFHPKELLALAKA